MRRERFLAVCGPLHSPENLLEILSYPPTARSHRFCEAHLAKHGEACNVMSCPRSRHVAQASLCRLPRDREKLRSHVRTEFLRVLQEPAVDRGEPLLGDLTTFRLRPVKLRAIPQLTGA